MLTAEPVRCDSIAAMSFEWYESTAPRAFPDSWAARSREATRLEIRERAALLMRLGRTSSEAVERCKQNIRWQYSGEPDAALIGEVDGLVTEVFGRTLTLDPCATGDV